MYEFPYWLLNKVVWVHLQLSLQIALNEIASLREKCPNPELFLVRIFQYSDWKQENTDQKQLRIWTLFTQ